MTLCSLPACSQVHQALTGLADSLFDDLVQFKADLVLRMKTHTQTIIVQDVESR